MTDKFNPYESEYGPGEKFTEIGGLVPISEIRELLAKIKEEHSEHYLKKCPHCENSIMFYRDDWYFCPQHNFVKLEDLNETFNSR